MAASVAGEDIRRGDFLALLNVVSEWPTFYWDSPPTEDVMRLKVIPADAGIPFKVRAVCLPFVYVKPPNGPIRTIDLRMAQVVRLDRAIARRVWRGLGSAL